MREAQLIKIKSGVKASGDHSKMEWQLLATAPFNRDLELAVIEGAAVYALVFPCRRVVDGWLKSGTKERVEVHPTHWRDWQD